MKLNIGFLIAFLLFAVQAQAQTISGKWVGELLQSPGGLATKYYFEMTLKQKENIISGTSKIVMGKDKESSGLMRIRGTFDGTYFYYEDIKILNEEGMNENSAWCIKKCKFKFSKVGSNYVLEGHWTGNSTFGYCSPGTIKVSKKADSENPILVIKEKKDSGSKAIIQTFPKVIIKTIDDEGNQIAAKLEIKKKGSGTQVHRTSGKYTLELTEGKYHVSAKESGYYDGVKNFEVKKGTANEVTCILKKIREGDSFEIANLQFERSKATITQDSKETLNKLVEFMKVNTQVKIRINGHTDNVGSNYLNRLLSYNRANAVVAYLVKNGISQHRLTAKGFGSTVPIADNKTTEGRAKNRRVEFEVMGL
ncbi:MAG: OmpA family protein [Flammeovirgaceae bacterium]